MNKRLVELSEKKLTFGKYKDETFKNVYDNAQSYCNFLLRINMKNNEKSSHIENLSDIREYITEMNK